jgi:probable F420-dependent oxidoreductase
VLVRVAVQANPVDRSSWLTLAREVEDAGFAALYVADHPGSAASPFVALAGAAAVTERIELGTCVVNAGVWEPLDLASAVATLDLVSDGRALLGVGAGHTPHEWTSVGRLYPDAGARVDRMIEVVEATSALLRGGPVSYEGAHISLAGAELDVPRPVRRPVPLMVGGAGRRVLRFGACRADVVGITGLGRTLADGHQHEVDWRRESVERTLDVVSSAAATVGREPEVEALVQAVEITDDARSVAERLAGAVQGATADDILDAPFTWIGTVEEIRAKVERWREAGIGRYVIRAPAVTAARRVL